MKFLGGFLKFLSILLMIVGTAACAVVIVMAEYQIEACIVMGGVWLLVIFVGLNIWGTGLALGQISKLKKRIAQLEQRPVMNPYYPYPQAAAPTAAPAAPITAPVAAPVAEASMEEVSSSTETVAQEPIQPPVQPVAAPESKPAKATKPWLPAVIVGVVAIVVIAGVVLVMGGNKDSNPSMQQPGFVDPGNIDSPASPEGGEVPDMIPEEPPMAEEVIPVDIGGSIETKDFIMTFNTVEVLDDYSYRTSDISTTSLYVEEGYKLLAIRGHFENVGNATIQDSAFSMTATINGDFVLDGYDVRIDFERNKSFEVDPYTDLDYVIHCNIPEKLAAQFETVDLTIGFNDDMSTPVTIWDMEGNQTVEVDNKYALSSSLVIGGFVGDSEIPSGNITTPISLGETIYGSDYEFTLKNVELTYELLPPNTSSVYTSYPAESGKVYVHVDADVKNTMQRDLRIEELFKTTVLYDGKYNYTGFPIVTDGDNRFDWVSSYVAATPLETCLAHGLVECPVEVDESGNPITVFIEISGTVYEYSLR